MRGPKSTTEVHVLGILTAVFNPRVAPHSLCLERDPHLGSFTPSSTFDFFYEIAARTSSPSRRFSNKILNVWASKAEKMDVVIMMRAARDFVDRVVSDAPKGRKPLTRGQKEKLYNLLIDRMSSGGEKRHHELAAEVNGTIRQIWGVGAASGEFDKQMKQMEERMAEVRERALEQGPVDVELAGSGDEGPVEQRVWVSDPAAGLTPVTSDELPVGSWEGWLEDGENTLRILRDSAQEVMELYRDELPETARAVLAEEIERRAEVAETGGADVAREIVEKLEGGEVSEERTPSEEVGPSSQEQVMQQMLDEGAPQKGGPVEKAMEDPWESMKAAWGYPYMEEPWLVDTPREVKKYTGPPAGTMFMGLVMEVLPERGGALISLEKGNGTLPPVILDYDFEEVPLRYIGEEPRYERARKRERNAALEKERMEEERASESESKASEAESSASGPEINSSEAESRTSELEKEPEVSEIESASTEAAEGEPYSEEETTSEKAQEAGPGADEGTSESPHEPEPVDVRKLLTERVHYKRYSFLFMRLAGQKCTPDLRDTIWMTMRPGQYILLQVKEGRVAEDGQPMPVVSTAIEINGQLMVSGRD